MSVSRFGFGSPAGKRLTGSSLQVGLTAAFYQTRRKDGWVLARLARAAEECHIRRNLAGLEAFSDALMGMEWEPTRSIGHYYRALF
jgi:hypothetical protein